MEDIQQTSELSWIEVQFLKKAVDVTVQCRTTLQWSYAFAYYLQRDHQTEIFEVIKHRVNPKSPKFNQYVY